jgi:hypothetical protein
MCHRGGTICIRSSVSTTKTASTVAAAATKNIPVQKEERKTKKIL